MTLMTLQEQLAPIAAAIVVNSTPAEIKTRYAYFNPMEFVATRLTELPLKAKLASRAVWMLDNRIIDTAISLYFEVRADNADAGNDLQKLTDAFIGMYSDEQYWGMGNASKLIALLNLQAPWHAAAYRINRANGYTNFSVRTIDALLINAKPRQLAPQARQNLKTCAEFVAAGIEDGVDVDKLSKEDRAKLEAEKAEAAKVAFDQLIEHDRMRAESNVEFRRSLLPAVNTFIMQAFKYIDGRLADVDYNALSPDDRRTLLANSGDDDADEEYFGDFTKLDASTKLMLTRGVLTGVAMTMTDLAKIIRDSTAYMMILREAGATRKTLTAVTELLAKDVEREQRD